MKGGTGKPPLCVGNGLGRILLDKTATEVTEPTENEQISIEIKKISVFLRSARLSTLGDLGVLGGWCVLPGAPAMLHVSAHFPQLDGRATFPI